MGFYTVKLIIHFARSTAIIPGIQQASWRANGRAWDAMMGRSQTNGLVTGAALVGITVVGAAGTIIHTVIPHRVSRYLLWLH